jgi:ribosomal protein RSM22 (predicted rRNA methylase)
LDDVLAGTRTAQLSAAVDRIRTAYRSNTVPTAPIIALPIDALAYAAYRMPATFASVRNALEHAQRAVPGFAPQSVLDLGAGTGAASWAVEDTFAPASFVLIEQVDVAIALGRELAMRSTGALRDAMWRQVQLTASPLSMPAVDLAVAAYVLAELDEQTQRSLIDMAAADSKMVVLVEPGTPAGHARVLAARDRLLQVGFRIAAPCPHEAVCPLLARADWCHFAARIPRTERHRRLKDAHLNYEDEKFSYVVAIKGHEALTPRSRIIRRPAKRKGLVSLELCVRDGRAHHELVGKKTGDRYRDARRAEWGDGWPYG